MESGLTKRLLDAHALEEVFNSILEYPSLGPFLSYQLTIDLNYSSILNFEENDFVVAGPGAKSGLFKCFPDPAGFSAEDLIHWMVDNQQNEFAYYGLDFKDLFGRSLKLIDAQNLFCETDKYARVAHPQVRGVGNRLKIKQHFTPLAEPGLPFFPPKWELNNAAAENFHPAVSTLW